MDFLLELIFTFFVEGMTEFTAELFPDCNLSRRQTAALKAANIILSVLAASALFFGIVLFAMGETGALPVALTAAGGSVCILLVSLVVIGRCMADRRKEASDAAEAFSAIKGIEEEKTEDDCENRETE